MVAHDGATEASECHQGEENCVSCPLRLLADLKSGYGLRFVNSHDEIWSLCTSCSDGLHGIPKTRCSECTASHHSGLKEDAMEPTVRPLIDRGVMRWGLLLRDRESFDSVRHINKK